MREAERRLVKSTRQATAEPDPHRARGAYKQAMAWSAKHPNPLAPRPFSVRIRDVQ